MGIGGAAAVPAMTSDYLHKKEGTSTVDSAAVTGNNEANIVSTDGKGRDPATLWFISGKYYDLSSVAKWHPGGALPIWSSQGVIDATPAFKSYHAFCNLESIESSLTKYEYKGPVSNWKFQPAPLRPLTFEKNGFYETLTKRVRASFPGDTNGSQRVDVKTTFLWWLRFAFLLSMYFIFLYSCQYYTIAAFFLGYTMYLTGFNVWHDVCHNGGPVNVNLREAVILISTYLGSLMDTEVWGIHHNIKHHSYTGAHKHDPDDSTWNTAPGFVLIMVSGPAQCLFYLYFRLTGKKNLWYINRPAWLKADIGPTTLAPVVHFVAMSLYAGVGTALLSGLGMSVAYMTLVWADHFMPDTAQDSREIFDVKFVNTPIDWGEVQVRGSGDFFPNSLLADCLAGGMNYQIEHHLFPSMCSVHYPRIAPIVKATCEEFNIPYRVVPSVLDILKNLLSHRGTWI